MKKEIVVPAAGESVTEADIVEWRVASGAYVTMDDELLELETDKASMPLTAPISGIVTIKVAEGTVKVGDVIGFVEEAQAPAASAAPAAKAPEASVPAPAPAVASSSSSASGIPSPAAAKILAEKNVSASSVSGSGKDGRITKEDALKASVSTTAASSGPKAAAPAPVAKLSGSREVRREKMSRIRRVISERLVNAQQETASLTTFNEVDLHEVIAIRSRYKDAFKEKYGVGLGFMSFFTKAVCIALQQYPIINAFMDGDELIYHDYCDVGIAVATPKGLVVPVIRDAQQLGFADIESAIRNFAIKGKEGRLTPDDLTGGTFTITNGGTFGSMLSTPILNRPQSAILGMHNIVERPHAVNGEVKVRPIMYVALTYDHRLIDGADAVRFLVTVKQLLEDPARLMIGL